MFFFQKAKKESEEAKLQEWHSLDIEQVGDKTVGGLYRMLADTKALHIQSQIIGLLKQWQDELPGAPIITPVRVAECSLQGNESFKMFVLDTFTVKGLGVLASGAVFRGRLDEGDSLLLQKADGTEKTTRCLGIDIHNSDEIQNGAFISIRLENIFEHEIEIGDALVCL